MCRRRDELLPHRIEVQQLLVEEAALEAEGSALRGELKQLGLVLPEMARGESAHVYDSHHSPPSDQRGAEQRLDSSFAQEGVENVGMIDVVQSHGAALGRDASSESLADGDVNSALDLFLYPLGRPRDELVAIRVERKKECAGVGL